MPFCSVTLGGVERGMAADAAGVRYLFRCSGFLKHLSGSAAATRIFKWPCSAMPDVAHSSLDAKQTWLQNALHSAPLLHLCITARHER